MKWVVRKLVSSRSRRLWMRRLRIPLTLRGGVKINSHRIQSQWIADSLIKGRYEFDEASSLDALIQPDDRILELGSGLGYVACLAGKKAHRGQVLSFEANPKMVDLAKETVQLLIQLIMSKSEMAFLHWMRVRGNFIFLSIFGRVPWSQTLIGMRFLFLRNP